MSLFMRHTSANTGLEHPMRDEILASQSQDFDSVIARLVGPQETQITYQKQMTSSSSR